MFGSQIWKEDNEEVPSSWRPHHSHVWCLMWHSCTSALPKQTTAWTNPTLCPLLYCSISPVYRPSSKTTTTMTMKDRTVEVEGASALLREPWLSTLWSEVCNFLSANVLSEYRGGWSSMEEDERRSKVREVENDSFLPSKGKKIGTKNIKIKKKKWERKKKLTNWVTFPSANKNISNRL